MYRGPDDDPVAGAQLRDYGDATGASAARATDVIIFRVALLNFGSLRLNELLRPSGSVSRSFLRLLGLCLAAVGRPGRGLVGILYYYLGPKAPESSGS